MFYSLTANFSPTLITIHLNVDVPYELNLALCVVNYVVGCNCLLITCDLLVALFFCSHVINELPYSGNNVVIILTYITFTIYC